MVKRVQEPQPLGEDEAMRAWLANQDDPSFEGWTGGAAVVAPHVTPPAAAASTVPGAALSDAQIKGVTMETLDVLLEILNQMAVLPDGSSVASEGLQAASASSVVRLHYAHRYALPHVAQAPTVVLSGVALAGGPLAAAGLAVGWVLPGAPMHRLDASYLDRQAERTDLWVGREHTAELDALTFVVDNTPEDAVLYDMSQSRPMPILAAGRPWVWCSSTFDNCGTAMQQGEGSIAAIVWANDFISSELPQGPRELIQREGGAMPTSLGSCWTRVGHLQPEAALYEWTCPERPRPWPDKRKAPRAPTWERQGASGGG